MIMEVHIAQHGVLNDETSLDFPYEPTYQKEWKIGSQPHPLT